jgi:hypothetical protein
MDFPSPANMSGPGHSQSVSRWRACAFPNVSEDSVYPISRPTCRRHLLDADALKTAASALGPSVSFQGISKGHRVMHATTCPHTSIKLISVGLLFQASSTFKDDQGCRRGQLRRWMRLQSGMPRCEC